MKLNFDWNEYAGLGECTSNLKRELPGRAYGRPEPQPTGTNRMQVGDYSPLR